MKRMLLAMAAAAVLAVDGMPTAGGEASVSAKMVWAHHTPWHTPDNGSLLPLRYVNHTTFDIGADPFKDEIRRAMAQGIDGFFFDVCFKRGAATFSDLRDYLSAAEGTPFLCAVCLDRKTDVSNQVAVLVKILARNAGHPNYAKVDGKPVVATYTWHDWTPDEWRRIRDGLDAAGTPVWLVANLGLGQKPYDTSLLEKYAEVFDAGYYFGYGAKGPSKARKNEIAADICARHGRLFMPAVAPGYYGGWVHGRNDFYTPFRGIDAIQGSYEAAMHTPGANWLHLTTWNDYDETALEPCRLSPGCFALVRAYADGWKRLPPSLERVDAILAYHREEFAGTVVRFEAMRLPSRDRGEIAIAGRLRDKDGRIVAVLPAKVLSNEWQRVEWLVASGDLAASPVLLPEFAMKDARGKRRVRTPGVFLVRGWLEAPETVRVTFGDCAPVDGDLSVAYSGGVISAKMSFSGETTVKRAILYRNDRPLAQFAPGEKERSVRLSLCARGSGNWRVSAKKGRIEEVLRTSCPKSVKGRLRLGADAASSTQTPDWASCALRAAGKSDMTLSIVANKEKREISPHELAEVRRISVGGIAFAMSPDLTIYERAPWDAASGAASLLLFDRKPRPEDAFWVRFETSDGRAAATAPIWPFAPEDTVENAVLVETPVTLESPSGPDRKPDSTEFRTPFEEWPVKATRLATKPASKLSIRRAFWPLGGRTGAEEPAKEANVIGDRAIAGGKLPLRMWPTGPSTISFDVNPDPFDGKRQTLLVRKGWMDGVSEIALTPGGCVEAAYGDHGKLVTARGRTPLKPGRWTRVAVQFDGIALKVFLDGVEDASASLDAPVRCYGNCTAWIGGDFKGGFANLSLTGAIEEAK